MSKIKIVYKEIDGQCEDCGYYTSKYLTITQDGKELLSVYEDGHFGNGNNLTDPLEVLKLVLEKLGNDVEIVESFED